MVLISSDNVGSAGMDTHVEELLGSFQLFLFGCGLVGYHEEKKIFLGVVLEYLLCQCR